MKGNTKIVQALVERFPKLEIDQVNKLGQTALIKAAIQGKAKCALVLLKNGASPDKKDYGRNFCALEWSKYVGRTECAETIAKFMVEPCKRAENRRLPNASNNLKQVACLIAIPIIGGDNLPAVARPRVRSAPPIPVVKITPSDGKFINPHKKVTRPSSSMA
ncbi:Ankyrin repeat protein [Aphelenchoides bicaudatus]|nr:Ankyrin repeat protein [Aphelenchoides bicaudatus]